MIEIPTTAPRSVIKNNSDNLENIEGVGPATAQHLRKIGLNTQLIVTTPIRELESVYQISAVTARKYQCSIIQQNGGWFSDALKLLETQKQKPSFTSGVQNIDDILYIPQIANKGIILGDTYELFGTYRSGKSQICHQLCVTIQLPRKFGGLEKKAIYVDTEGTFSPSRLFNMINRMQGEYGWKKSMEHILRDISYARIKSSDQQIMAIYSLLDFLILHNDEYGLLIIDSISSHFRAEYTGRDQLADRQQKINHHLSIIQRISSSFGIAVVITNQVVSNPTQFLGDANNAVGGNILGHWAGTRLYLRKSKGNQRIIRIVDSSVLPELEGVFEITEDGVV